MCVVVGHVHFRMNVCHICNQWKSSLDKREVVAIIICRFFSSVLLGPGGSSIRSLVRTSVSLFVPQCLHIFSKKEYTSLVKYVSLYTTLVPLSGSPCLNYPIILNYYKPCVGCTKAHHHQTSTYISATSHIHMHIVFGSSLDLKIRSFEGVREPL